MVNVVSDDVLLDWCPIPVLYVVLIHIEPHVIPPVLAPYHGVDHPGWAQGHMEVADPEIRQNKTLKSIIQNSMHICNSFFQ